MKFVHALGWALFVSGLIVAAVAYIFSFWLWVAWIGLIPGIVLSLFALPDLIMFVMMIVWNGFLNPYTILIITAFVLYWTGAILKAIGTNQED